MTGNDITERKSARIFNIKLKMRAGFACLLPKNFRICFAGAALAAKTTRFDPPPENLFTDFTKRLQFVEKKRMLNVARFFQNRATFFERLLSVGAAIRVGVFEKRGMNLTAFVKKNAVLCIALIAAAITMCFVPPDAEYLEYFDLKTLACLYGTLAVVCALRNIFFFRYVAGSIVRVFKNLRAAVLALVYITLFGSMLIANDMALITFLPLGYFVLDSTGNRKSIPFVFIMQNVAANLGGMLTPFGNPQNLYLYSFYHIGNAEFVKIMAMPFLLSFVLITVCCLFVRPTPLAVGDYISEKPSPVRTGIYLVLFFLSIAMVFRLLPWEWGIGIITASLVLLDREALWQVDYGLLLTFCAFFVFSGNMARIDAVRELLSGLVGKNPLLYGILSCQCISNVPSAVLLSHFTDNYAALLRAVNIGGIGTLISSLASLITFREYNRCADRKPGRYLLLFSAINFGLLLILGFACAYL